jgi:hypothetical protein
MLPAHQSVPVRIADGLGGDLAVLAAWAAGGLLVSVRFFQWDPRRPRHARPARSAGGPR